MKTLTQACLVICFCLLQFFVSYKAHSQCVSSATGNHLNMTMENCTQTSDSIIEFDLFITSDGASTSDLRLNSVSYGINFNTAILPSGATISPDPFVGNTD